MMTEQPEGMIQFKIELFGFELSETYNNDLEAHIKAVMRSFSTVWQREIVAAIEDVLSRNLSNEELVAWWRVGRPDLVFWEGLDHILPMILREAKAALQGREAAVP